MVGTISCPQLLEWKWGDRLTGVYGAGLFDKLKLEERETWTAELWRSCGDARGKDFGGPVSGCSVNSWVLHRT